MRYVVSTEWHEADHKTNNHHHNVSSSSTRIHPPLPFLLPMKKKPERVTMKLAHLGIGLSITSAPSPRTWPRFSNQQRYHARIITKRNTAVAVATDTEALTEAETAIRNLVQREARISTKEARRRRPWAWAELPSWGQARANRSLRRRWSMCTIPIIKIKPHPLLDIPGTQCSRFWAFLRGPRGEIARCRWEARSSELRTRDLA